MNNIYVLNKNYKKIGTLSNQGANPQAPYFNDLYVQELDTGADTYQFSTMSTPYTQDLLEIGNHIMFAYKNRNELFTITSIEYSHNEGYKTIGVYAEGIGFELLEVFMERPDTSNSGGNDVDGDGDDNTDGEYADVDHFYIDETGVIIWDKNGNKPSEDDITIDGDGNIIYRPSKHNKKNDSLEFKNISYPRFLSILLKNSGWSYVCQPGLESIKHDISVRYDTNIYAILQDSMQSYRGVELEFVHEYNGGRVQKVIKAYKDGGRGSFVGKRFEYGKNVRGITKTQEVTDSEDDTILYIDNVGINVQYDVDFALKSAEVPEIEIGDTHYVIDKDFYPPMTIKARIGKIEISFSDPTVNKIYLANNKRISGSAIEEEFGADDVSDMLDDYDFGDDGGYEDFTPNHYHDSLRSKKYTEIEDSPGAYEVGWSNWCVKLEDNVLRGNVSDTYHLGDSTFPWDFAFTNVIKNKDSVTSPRYFGYNYHVRYDRTDMEDVKKITDSGDVTKQDLLNFIINDLNIYEYGVTEVNEVVNKDVDDPTAYFDKKYFGILSEDVYSSSGNISRVGNRVQAPVVTDDTNNDGDQNANDEGTYHAYNIPALLSCLIGAFQYHVSGGEPTGPTNKDQNDDGYDGDGGKPGSGGDSGSDGDPDNPGSGNYGKITCSELEVSGADGSAGIANVFGELYVTEKIKCELTIEANTVDANTVKASLFDGYQSDLNILTVGEYLQLPDGTKIYGKGDLGGDGESTPNTGSYPNIFDPDASPREDIYVGYVDCAGFNAIEGHIGALSTTQIFGWNNSTSDTIEIYGDVEVIGNITAKNISGGSASDNTFDTITVTKIKGPDPGEGQYNVVEFEDAIRVGHIWSTNDSGIIDMQDKLVLHNGFSMYENLEVEADVEVLGVVRASDFIKWSDRSLKENIRYIDAPTNNEGLLEKADLYDFIVNQLNICEYNYIDNPAEQIGLIANDYEGTKVGDKIVTRDEEKGLLSYNVNNLLFATIGALQEEVRIKDEKIASLEDRLARIEAMLGINND